MTQRRCATCKHFEQAPMFRKGWCRNPLLYSPQQSHLVSEDDLDCDRGMGNYWDPSDDFVLSQSRAFSNRGQTETAHGGGDPASDTGTVQMRSSRGVPIYPVSGSSGYGSEPPPPGGSDPGGWGGDDRNQFGYYDDERYWTDYLRIVAPLLGVIIFVALLWWWIASTLGDDNGDDGDIAADATGTESVLPSVEADSPTSTTGDTGTAAPPGTVTLPAATTSPGDGTAPAGTEPPVSSGALCNGCTAEVANTGGTGVNVRAEATTSSEILNVYLDGTQVQIIGDPVDAEGFTWWPVTGEAVEMGWIVQNYLVLVE